MADVFVFGSNREGRHGKGAALEALRKWGAIYGQAEGRQGNAYGIVTKELRRNYPPVTLLDINVQTAVLAMYVEQHPEDTFIVTKIGCGLAGFREEDIAPMVARLRYWPNVILPEGW
jgi:hypothetical protein